MDKWFSDTAGRLRRGHERPGGEIGPGEKGRSDERAGQQAIAVVGAEQESREMRDHQSHEANDAGHRDRGPDGEGRGRNQRTLHPPHIDAQMPASASPKSKALSARA